MKNTDTSGKILFKDLFEQFDGGKFAFNGKTVNFSELKWNGHPVFEGVELKNLITAKDTDGRFSFHLVKIAPDKSIGNHIHENQLETHEVIAGSGQCICDGKKIEYAPGNISLIPAGVTHEVHAVDKGLYLFAKFIPAL